MNDLREFMRRVPQCVTVVTTYVNNQPHGMTVSSFTSVSLDPPLILIVLDKSTQTCKSILQAKHFCVNLLSNKQSAVSDVFAYVPHEERFQRVKYSVQRERYPVLDGVVAYLFCEVHSFMEASTHNIIIGLVREVRLLTDELPLIYLQRQYHSPVRVTESA